jgi:hypothetical protein
MKFPIDIELIPATCCVCGVIFGLPVAMQENLLARRGRAIYWCPSGHAQCYPDKEDK